MYYLRWVLPLSTTDLCLQHIVIKYDLWLTQNKRERKRIFLFIWLFPRCFTHSQFFMYSFSPILLTMWKKDYSIFVDLMRATIIDTEHVNNLISCFLAKTVRPKAPEAWDNTNFSSGSTTRWWVNKHDRCSMNTVLEEAGSRNCCPSDYTLTKKRIIASNRRTSDDMIRRAQLPLCEAQPRMRGLTHSFMLCPLCSRKSTE
jgi:hypothetical protein